MSSLKSHQWRSLADFADPDRPPTGEFAPLASEWPDGTTRRNFLKLMSASLALAGLNGCTRPPSERIVPYVRQPEELVPGQPLYFATALTLDGYARGVLVESHEGRPTKIEGNPLHPASLGASDVFMQAELLGLYDPDRSKTVMREHEVSSWEKLLAVIADQRTHWTSNHGEGLSLLTPHTTSPTLLDQISQLLREFPAARWHVHDPTTFARPKHFYNLSKADVIVSLDDDFLGPGPAQLRYIRDFTNRRRAHEGPNQFNRLYVAESTPSLTGAAADHRLNLSPSALRDFAETLFSSNGKNPWQPLLADLHANRGRSLILPADWLPEDIHQRAQAWNRSLQLTQPKPSTASSFAELADEIQRGKVETLIILSANPVYTAPANLEFEKLLKQVPFRLHLGLHENETSALCHWHVPEAHPLEAWSDARAFDGTATIIQPLIEPLYAGKSAHELLAALSGRFNESSYNIVRRHWQSQNPNDFEHFWRRSLHDGVVTGSASPMDAAEIISNKRAEPKSIQASPGTLELLIRPDPHIHDERFSNNAWLQELPKPFTKLTWENAALISPSTAHRLQVANEDEVQLKYHGRSVIAPVLILPGQSDDCVTVHLGYGRTRAGNVGSGIGFNAYALQTSDAPWGGPGLEIVKTGRKHPLATTQHQQTMDGRDLVRHSAWSTFQKNPLAAAQTSEPPPAPQETLYPPVEYKNHAWAMAIDLGACVGCNVCTIACQAENNIPVVGKTEVSRGRAMHWIRVDNYFEGTPERPAMHFQPVPCMHCENAPCELVCPVGATVHSSEGINQMVYNRCIGTRYCSNNCPYKVRRFNFLEYGRNQFESPDILAMLRNPDVSVRTRGVMEKCTYCIQRINRVRIEAEKKNLPIRDGEIVPACAQACPARAIVFGDQNDPQSLVAKLKASPLNYSLLAELNARPRTTYLAKVRNPNPEFENS